MQSPETLRAQATVGPADVAELRARIEGQKLEGQVLDEANQVHATGAAKIRQLFFAREQSGGVVGAFMDWLRGQNS